MTPDTKPRTLAAIVSGQKKRRLSDIPATFTWPELIALELLKPVEQRVKVPLRAVAPPEEP